MELSRQMLLLTAENYGSYFLHITKQLNLWNDFLYLEKKQKGNLFLCLLWKLNLRNIIWFIMH